MEGSQNNLSLGAAFIQFYAPFAGECTPEQLAKWGGIIRELRKTYPAWNTPLDQFERHIDSYPNEAITLLSLFPPLILETGRRVTVRDDIAEQISRAIMGMGIDREVADTIRIIQQLCLAIYSAGYSDGQQNPEKNVLS